VALRAPLPGLADRCPGWPVTSTNAWSATRGGDPGHPRAPGHQAGQQRPRAIDLTLVAGQLSPCGRRRRGLSELVYDAMVVALSGRIFLDETVDATPEAVLRQIWEDQFILSPAAAAPG